MYSVKAAIIAALKADAVLRALTAPHVSGSGSAGVYGAIPVPPTATLPYVAVPGTISDVPVDTFDAEYRSLIIDIHVYADRPDVGGGSTEVADAITERVRAILHRNPIPVPGANPLVFAVEGIRPSDDIEAFGRILSLRLLIGVPA